MNYKESEWPQFNEEFKELQLEEIIRTLSGRGQYRLIQQFSHYSVSPSKWIKMKPEQCRKVITQFDKATKKNKRTMPPGSIHASASTSIVTEQPSEK